MDHDHGLVDRSGTPRPSLSLRREHDADPASRFIGVAEVAGALGLILPGLLRIRPMLTPLAACGLVIIMIGATVVTLADGDVVSALVPLVVGLLSTAVAYGRRSWA